MIRVVQYIENSHGERAYIGDIIQLDLMVATGIGSSGELIAIEPDRISYKAENIWAPPSWNHRFYYS